MSFHEVAIIIVVALHELNDLGALLGASRSTATCLMPHAAQMPPFDKVRVPPAPCTLFTSQ